MAVSLAESHRQLKNRLNPVSAITQVQATELLPVFFRLFRCRDKVLRGLVFNHIIADIKSSNQRHRDERLNRSVQVSWLAERVHSSYSCCNLYTRCTRHGLVWTC